jgi:hypothetical protein
LHNKELSNKVEELRVKKEGIWSLSAFLGWATLVAILNQYR